MRKVTVVAIVEQHVPGNHSLRDAGKIVEQSIRSALNKEGLFHVETITVCPDTVIDQLVERLKES